MRYRFVLLDAGDTLVGPRESFGATYARALAPLGFGATAERFESALRETWAELEREVPPGTDRYGHFEDGEEGYWLRFARSTVAKATGAPVAERIGLEALGLLRQAFALREAWEVFPDVVPALEALRDLGVRLAVVSNWDSRLPAVLDRLDLSRHFDAVVVSHLEGVEKPDPEIFRRALSRLAATPDAALHVGDLPRVDLDGARAAGLDGVLVDRRGRLDPAHRALPDLSLLPRIARDGLA